MATRRWERWGTGLLLMTTTWGGGQALAAQQDVEARRIVEHAVELAGGEAALRSVHRVALDMMTQWQRPSFRGVPYRDRPSFEPHYDVRDYTIPAWRNTRDFGASQIVNVVRDSVAVSSLNGGADFRPLSVAYVDERKELFTYTPDRLMLALLDAPDLSAAADTVIGGERHRRVRATLAGGYPSEVYFHTGSGLPTMLEFHAGHPADFGLVPWGRMEVEVWYSGWRTFGEIAIPKQWDITRAGEPYKRMTVRRADFEPEFEPADSFRVSDEARTEYWSSLAPLPMHEGVRIEERRTVEPGLVELVPPFGVPVGAVSLGEGWMLLGAGQTSFNYEQGVGALREEGAAPVTAVLAAEARTTNGGVRSAARAGLPIYVSGASEPFVRRMLEESDLSMQTVVTVSEETRLGHGEAEVILAPVDLPDVPGSLMLHRPATGWLYVPDARDPLDVRLARQQADRYGWSVRTVGTSRGLSDPV